MNKAWRIIVIIAAGLFALGLALLLASLLTGGNITRILGTTDVADYTKFFSEEQLIFLRSLFP